jgi:hypothetical protein
MTIPRKGDANSNYINFFVQQSPKYIFKLHTGGGMANTRLIYGRCDSISGGNEMVGGVT